MNDLHCWSLGAKSVIIGWRGHGLYSLCAVGRISKMPAFDPIFCPDDTWSPCSYITHFFCDFLVSACRGKTETWDLAWGLAIVLQTESFLDVDHHCCLAVLLPFYFILTGKASDLRWWRAQSNWTTEWDSMSSSTTLSWVPEHRGACYHLLACRADYWQSGTVVGLLFSFLIQPERSMHI